MKFSLNKKRIYMDHASLTPIDPRVIKIVDEYSKAEYANPSSWYKEGVAAKKALDAGRKGVAEFLHGHADEVVFTSGGTEANGLVLEGAGRAFFNLQIKSGISPTEIKPNLIISEVEHSSVREVAAMMERHGVEVTRIGVDEKGIVKLDELKKAIKPSTYMVSIMKQAPFSQSVRLPRLFGRLVMEKATPSFIQMPHKVRCIRI